MGPLHFPATSPGCPAIGTNALGQVVPLDGGMRDDMLKELQRNDLQLMHNLLQHLVRPWCMRRARMYAARALCVQRNDLQLIHNLLQDLVRPRCM